MNDRLIPPLGLSHLVITVREMDESHRFWADIVGFRQVGERRPTAEEPDVPYMRFYVGDRGPNGNHHDIALWQITDFDPAATPSAIQHIAVAFPDRASWLERISFVQKSGVKFGRRLEHGMTHSCYVRDPNGHGVELLYDLPREVWAGDVNAALNFLIELPTSGPPSLADNEDVPVFGKGFEGTTADA